VGSPPDSACLLKAEQAFDTALSRAERRGGCVAPGDAGNLAAAIDRGVTDLAADTTGQCTAGCVEGCSGSFETCRWNGQTCGCGGSLNSCVTECSLIGTSGFCANVGDACDLGTCSCVAGSRSLACDAQKLEATGQELRAELLCRAKATTSDDEVVPACVTKAETTFGDAFTRIEDKAVKTGGCAVRNNALDVLDAVFPWINGIINVSAGCGWLLQEWNTYGVKDPREFAGIAVDKYGDLMVTDPEDQALLTFDSNGTLVGSNQLTAPPSDLEHLAGDDRTTYFILDGRAIGAEGDHGVTWEPESPPGTVLNAIFDIATDANGDVYVVGVAEDSTGLAVDFLDKYGFDPACQSCPVLLAQSQFGFKGVSPVAIAVGGPYANIHVGFAIAGSSGFVVFHLGSDGTPMSSWFPGESINRMAVDPCGNVLITSSDGQGTIAKYTADGQRITGWSATAPGEISANPTGIAVDGSGNVWTIDWKTRPSRSSAAHARRSVAIMQTVTTAFVKHGDRSPSPRLARCDAFQREVALREQEFSLKSPPSAW
jgi:hypothetical protein